MSEKWESVFRILDNSDRPPPAVRVLNLVNGHCYDFANRADAIAWIEGEVDAPLPMPMPELSAKEQAEWEAIERQIEAEYGPDDKPLGDV
jgi:hypothetical protein